MCVRAEVWMFANYSIEINNCIIKSLNVYFLEMGNIIFYTRGGFYADY